MSRDQQITSQSGTAPAPDQSLPRDRRLASALMRLEVHRRSEEQRAALGVADGRLLWLLADRRPRTLREIAHALKLEQSTVNRQVNAAVKSELLRRFTQPDRGVRLIEPTDRGLAVFEQTVTQTLDAYETALDALGSTKADEFLLLLEQFVDAYRDTLG